MLAPRAERLLTEALNDFSGELDLGRGRFWGLAFSRDGRRLAYAAADEAGCELRIADRAGFAERHRLGDGSLVTEVHGFCADGRYVVFTAADAEGRAELRAVDRAAGLIRRLANDHAFGGFDETRGGVLLWTRSSDGRQEIRVGFDGAQEARHRARLDRGYVRSFDGARAFVADKVSAEAGDRRFRIYEASSLWDAGARLVAEIELPFPAKRVTLDVSPDGAWLHVHATALVDGGRATFHRVLSADAARSWDVAPIGWLGLHRLLVAGESGAVDALDLRTGARTTFLTGPIEHLAVSRDAERIAYVRRGRLRITDVR